MVEILNSLPSSWKTLLIENWDEKERLLWQEKIQICLSETTTPPISKIFNAFENCLPENIKAIIIGQDPYPTLGHANGLCFSTEDFVQPFPKSLKNIFKELKRSIPNYDYPLTGNLMPWAQQGVLMLNTCLTTEVGIANGHKNMGWEIFTDKILNIVNEKHENLVVFFWGKQAEEKMKFFDSSKHLLLQTSHPSPLSVYRGFEGCNHFNLCNDYLRQKKNIEINWQT